MDEVNTNYAKVALLKIEEHETCNIPIPIEQVTIEHIMPQTLSSWWVANLGGKDQAERIFDSYLNCIGNLTLVSQSYNSKLSNKPWEEKMINFENVQFSITNEIAKNIKWVEDNILERNKSIAIRACEAITSPLERTRKYQTKTTTTEFIDGVYPVSDITTPMSGTVLEYIIYDNNTIEVSTWKEFLATICEITYKIDSSLFDEIVERNKIHKATSKKNYPEKDPIISSNVNLLMEAKPIGTSSYFSEGVISSDRARVYVKQLLDLYSLTDRFQISVRER